MIKTLLPFAVCTVCAVLPVSLLAGDLSPEAAIFSSVCMANAPSFDEGAIRSAAQSTTYSGGDILASGGVEYQPGKRCKVAFRISGPPDDAEVRAIATEFAQRVGGTIKAKSSAIGGARWYEVRFGGTKFGVEGGVSSGARYFTIAKR